MENYHRRPKTGKPKFEQDEHEASQQPSASATATTGNPQNRPQRPGVMVISMNGKIRAYVSRGLEVLSEGNGVADTTEETKDTKGKGSAQKNTLTSTSSSGSIPPSSHRGVLTIKAQGRAISKAVTVAEILKRRLEGSLHQFTEIGQVTEQEIWDPNEDMPNLDPLIVSRHRPTIRIRLSTHLPPVEASSAAKKEGGAGEHSDFGDDSGLDGEESEGEAWPGAVLDRDAAARRFVGYQEPTGNDIYL
ncbi:hypothetical protein BG005_000437 [Podila minutissima]|nr:hypothetical protein BG005_000437 [Podila minutissima]